MTTTSRHEYEQRLRRVLAHIDAHLGEPLDLAMLADVANFSPFHFHRVFAALMGETLGDHLRRRRLETAAVRLMRSSSASVLQVALDVGFGSGEAFSRAFRQRFGASPSAWRTAQADQRKHDQQHRKTDQLEGKPDQDAWRRPPDDAGSFQAPRSPPMNVKLIDRPEVTIAYLRHTGPYGEAVGQFWFDTVVPWMELHGLMGEPRYGIAQDEPSVTDASRCRYDAGVEVPPDFVPSGGAQVATLRGGRYAVLPVRATSDTIGDAWTAMLRDWLPDSGLKIAFGPCFEHYPRDAGYDPATGEFECEICLPVAPL